MGARAPFGRLLREVAQAPVAGPGERLEPRRQRPGDLALDVDVGIDLVDEEGRDLRADDRVVEQLPSSSTAQLSALSTWRLAHTAKIASTASIVATDSSART